MTMSIRTCVYVVNTLYSAELDGERRHTAGHVRLSGHAALAWTTGNSFVRGQRLPSPLNGGLSR